jgi:cytochrome c-type biogenesis protein CcmF
MIIARRQTYALLAAYILITLSYVLVLYASFLTRSGVLAETSAHSFGDNGMSMQLLVFLLTFLAMMVIMIAMNVRKFHVAGKDAILSREFWMFIGSIIMVLAAFQIIFTTSIPVVNSLFGTDIAPPIDRVGFYNRWQMPYALLIAGFIAFSQFLNYNDNEPRNFMRKMIIPAMGALVICIPIITTGIVTQMNFILLIFFVLFALIASIYNMFFQTAKPRNIGAIITHIGFVIFVLGTVLTFSNSNVISRNTSQYDLGDQHANAENLVLMRNDTLLMNDFYVTYVNNRMEVNTTIYRVDFLIKEKGNFKKEFTLYPSVNAHPRMGAVYNPDTRHFITRDYYAYVSSVSKEPDYIVIKAIMNPYINILWLGSYVMIAGLAIAFFIRARRRWRENS